MGEVLHKNTTGKIQVVLVSLGECREQLSHGYNGSWKRQGPCGIEQSGATEATHGGGYMRNSQIFLIHSQASLLYELSWFIMSDLPGYLRACLQTGKLASLAVLVSGGIVLQILACALYNNWWPMLTVIMYVLLPMPLVFFAGSDASSLYSESSNGWIDAAKFLTGVSTVGSIAIPVILKHSGVIGWGAMAMELSSFFVFVLAIICFIGTSEDDDGYQMF
ncbi:hypothetical protein DM860_014898 [Cuscuta australis]|uniref:Vacuolar protein sorting-associated protein 55 homolog n=2 Tax=Cuscuta sect. Cleistogrammica TaxID=1824901 RepID=A0A328E6I0_9ASTE|nr:hypothetical protein DM860_014898 [Cuscuta australis]